MRAAFALFIACTGGRPGLPRLIRLAWLAATWFALGETDADALYVCPPQDRAAGEEVK
jgi:hypothetical protein